MIIMSLKVISISSKQPSKKMGSLITSIHFPKHKNRTRSEASMSLLMKQKIK
jgi:hypothetical protein